MGFNYCHRRLRSFAIPVVRAARHALARHSRPLNEFGHLPSHCQKNKAVRFLSLPVAKKREQLSTTNTSRNESTTQLATTQETQQKESIPLDSASDLNHLLLGEPIATACP